MSPQEQNTPSDQDAPRVIRAGKSIVVSGTGNTVAEKINIGGNLYGDVNLVVSRLPKLIPYLVDRDQIVKSVRVSYESLRSSDRPAFFGVIHGTSDEAPNEMLIRLQDYHIPELLDDSRKVQLLQPRTPDEFDSAEELPDLFRENLGEALATWSTREKHERVSAISGFSSLPEMAEFLAGQEAVWVIANTIDLDDVRDEFGEETLVRIIAAYGAFWRDWFSQFTGVNVFAFLVLEQSERRQVEENSDFEVSSLIMQYLEVLQRATEGQLEMSVLEELKPIRMRHIKQWCRMLEMRDLERVPEDQVVADFSDYFEQNATKTIPMTQFARRVSKLAAESHLDLKR